MSIRSDKLLLALGILFSHAVLMKKVVLLIIIILPKVVAADPDQSWQEIPLEEVDTKLLAPRGHRLLVDEEYKWDHAKTAHFVIHYERKQFAQKVARMAEFYYDFIADDLLTAEDRVSSPSHIFIFRRPGDWEYFIQHYNVNAEWAFSLVSGYTMFLQQADDRSASGQVLGHEMTHMVFNRFYQGRLPLWLNEGTAEWYGTFAYDAYKGVRKNKRNVFRRVDALYPLVALLYSRTYPADRGAVSSFYETSKYLVGFLQLNYPDEKFEPFLNDVMRGMPSIKALQKHYEISTLDEFADEFKKFSR